MTRELLNHFGEGSTRETVPEGTQPKNTNLEVNPKNYYYIFEVTLERSWCNDFSTSISLCFEVSVHLKTFDGGLGTRCRNSF